MKPYQIMIQIIKILIIVTSLIIGITSCFQECKITKDNYTNLNYKKMDTLLMVYYFSKNKNERNTNNINDFMNFVDQKPSGVYNGYKSLLKKISISKEDNLSFSVFLYLGLNNNNFDSAIPIEHINQYNNEKCLNNVNVFQHINLFDIENREKIFIVDYKNLKLKPINISPDFTYLMDSMIIENPRKNTTFPHGTFILSKDSRAEVIDRFTEKKNEDDWNKIYNTYYKYFNDELNNGNKVVVFSYETPLVMYR